MVLPIAFRVQAANDNMKLHPSVRDYVKVTNLTDSMDSSMPKIAPARLVSKPTVPKQQSRNPILFIARQIRYAT
ncbi:unnamed protein product [Hymenolepis diminuta]|uniref:Uncharacterized protein n=1 Tax=Hymenolepis diminuta TaxID=6216 RepID=A0A564Z874_HYMDI|nr:unnamed protein product [Hymenolepis diminuta]